MNERKTLPTRHTWLSLLDLPIDATDQDVKEFLAASGLDLPLENIQMSDNPRTRQMAIIALSKHHVADLVWRATCEQTCKGNAVRVVSPQNILPQY